MKKLLFVAVMAIVAAGFTACGNSAPKANLKTDVDTMSYALGMSQTQGLKDYLVNSLGVDTAYMGEFIKGLNEGVNAGDNAKKAAYYAGIQIGQQISTRMIKGINREVFGDDSTKTISLKNFMSAFISGTTGKKGLMTMDQAQLIAQSKMREIKAREMIKNGDLGQIRVINMSFAFGAYNVKLEETNPAAKWRFDPSKAGISFAMADVGTHPLYLIEAMIPDMKIRKVLCTKQAFIEGRQLEDNAFTIMDLEGTECVQDGAQVYCWSSSINCGARHGHKIRIVGSKASIEWDDERPNQMSYEIEGEPVRTLERGAGYLYPEARVEDRIGGGHAEGLFEAWSNLYRRFAVAMSGADTSEYGDFWYPSVEAGAQGVKWLEKCVESANNNSVWVDFN